MSYWAEDPALYLHKHKHGAVHVLRCKKETMTSSSSSMLMKPEDFIDEGAVTHLQSLTGDSGYWNTKKYDTLIDYIYPRNLLVNCHGSLIVEIEPDQKSVLELLLSFWFLPLQWLLVNLFHRNNFLRNSKAAAVVYMRALDIVDMGSYGPGPDHPSRAVPVRAVKYLQDGMVVKTEPTPKEMELSEEVENLRHKLLLAEETVEAELGKGMKLSKEVETLGLQLLMAKKQIEVELATKIKLKEELAIKSSEVETLQQKYERLLKENTVRIYAKGATSCSLTIRNGKAVLGYTNNSDDCQYWVKDDKYSAGTKDHWGFPGYALVNKSTGQALKPNDASSVELVPYNPNVLDKSILWTDQEQGDGYRAIRKLTNPALNLDAANPTNSGIGDGTMAILCDWLDGDNQKWDIVSY